LVVDVDEVDVAEVAPFDAAPVEVADAIGRDVGDFDFDRVALWLEFLDGHAVGRQEEHAEVLAVYTNAGGIAEVNKVEKVALVRRGGGVEGQRVAGGAGEGLGGGVF